MNICHFLVPLFLLRTVTDLLRGIYVYVIRNCRFLVGLRYFYQIFFTRIRVNSNGRRLKFTRGVFRYQSAIRNGLFLRSIARLISTLTWLRRAMWIISVLITSSVQSFNVLPWDKEFTFIRRYVRVLKDRLTRRRHAL